ncbi:MAG: cob(I)yrinic acid a,c-diamide adenosyltransferase [Desulfovibrio sp.]|nr:cob(I)yrinic acid a,c-diamide adenosyltransferase [Desulfovibrio sp.]
MILVYTGNGKGKTSACVGQTVRALGQGLRVAFGQFMKQDGQAGEQAQLARWLGQSFCAGGQGFLLREEDRPRHRAAAGQLLAWAHRQLPHVDMLVLDESLYALQNGLLRREELETLMRLAREQGRHLVLSGRGAPDWLVEAADLVTDMGEVKHPWQTGVKATPGIEF